MKGPKVVGVLNTQEDLLIALRNPDIADIFEWRVDRLFGSWVVRCIKRLKTPIILTVRDSAEGGKRSDWDLKKRESLIRKYMHLATFVDIEALNARRLYKLICDIKLLGIKVIISCHSLDPLPFRFMHLNLRWAVEVCQAVKGDVLKVALHIVSASDMDDFEEWATPLLSEQENFGLFAPMATGKRFGRSSRKKFAQLGSALVYTYLNDAVVEGQWQAQEMATLLKKMHLRT